MLSAKITLPDSLKFIIIANLVSTLRNFLNFVSLKEVDKEVLSQIFPLTLGKLFETSSNLLIGKDQYIRRPCNEFFV